jgi:uncharacterized membrane protein YdbT with pleckstrin-like domain
MSYTLRPAWRSQLGLMTIAIALFFFTFLPLVQALISTSSTNFLSGLSLIFALPLIVVCALMLYRHYSSRFIIDGDIIESHHGIIARRVSSIRVEDLRNINVKQSIFQRLLGIGDVEFSSAASADAEVIFNQVANPMRVKEKVQEML